MLVTLDLAPYPSSVGEARRFTVDTLRRWGREDLTATGALLVTELVTNAILHARTVVQVCLVRRDDSVRVEVRDGSPVRPALRQHGLDATTGRGLALVARLAASWGVDVGESGGKVVWAQLAEELDEETPDQLFGFSDADASEPDDLGAGQSTTVAEHHAEAMVAREAMLGRCA